MTFHGRDIDFVEVVVHGDVPRIFILGTDCLPQLEAPWMVLQPDVFRLDPTKGWEPIDEASSLFLGSEELTQITFREEDPSTLCKIKSLGQEAFEVQNFSNDPIELIVIPRQHSHRQ